MTPTPILASSAPWVAWAVSSVALALDPMVGSVAFALASVWLCVRLARQQAPKGVRLLLLAATPAPAIAILLRQLPMLEDVGVILAPFYLAPAAIAVLAAAAAGLFTCLHRSD